MTAEDNEQVNSKEPLGHAPWACPLPMSHDRFAEADYFLHKMEYYYHEPQLFRFNFNAFVSAARAVHEMLQKELERKGEIQWWKQRRVEFANDKVLQRLTKGRNTALHQRSLIQGSSIKLGLFRGRRIKLTVATDIKTDEPSKSPIERMRPSLYGLIIDEAHSALAEQIGIERLYFAKELSEDEDVLRASRRALARTTRALSEAHNRLGADHTHLEDNDALDPEILQEVVTLIETDIDPSAATRWGWLDPVDEEDVEPDPT